LEAQPELFKKGAILFNDVAMMKKGGGRAIFLAEDWRRE